MDSLEEVENRPYDQPNLQDKSDLEEIEQEQCYTSQVSPLTCLSRES